MSQAGFDVDGLKKELAAVTHPRERAAIAGRWLASLGQPLRRGESCPDEALRALSAAEVEGWLEVVDTDAIRGDLSRAADAALEAVLAEGEAERGEWEGWALEGLASRDALDAALVALERWEALQGGLSVVARRSRERLERELARVDAQAAAIARRLIPINPMRREARDKLAPVHRQRAWWFAARAECDALMVLWRDPSPPDPDGAHCEACARDRDVAVLAQKPPSRCVSEDELWELDLGELIPARRRLVERHARACPECALALRALDVDTSDTPTPGGDLGPSSGPAPRAPEVLAQRPECQVLLFRGPRQARLSIVPAPGQRLAAAAVQLPRVAAALEARPAEGRLEVELGPPEKLRGAQARVTVTLASGRSLELEVGL